MEVKRWSILSEQKIKMVNTIECFKLKQSDSYLSDQIVKVKYLIKRSILNYTYKFILITIPRE